MKKILTALVLFLVLCNTAMATGPGSGYIFVSGTVTDKSSNETLPGVEVRVKGTDIVTYTNFDGNFYLPELPKGTYTLEFSYITYSSATVIADGSNAEPEITVEMQQR
jgi:hypothetical protein